MRLEAHGPKEGSGHFMMRWTVLPSGATTDVALETEGLRGTALANCLESRLRAWKFPAHRSQQPPIRFPFTY